MHTSLEPLDLLNLRFITFDEPDPEVSYLPFEERYSDLLEYINPEHEFIVSKLIQSKFSLPSL